MTKMLSYPNLSIHDILINPTSIIYNNQGIDTIRLTAVYTTVKNKIDEAGLNTTTPKRGKANKSYQKALDEVKRDTKTRYKADKFPPIVEVVQLPKAKGKGQKPLFMAIIRNTPELFDLSTKQKKAKDHFCMIVIAGLHQPTIKLETTAIKIISKFLKMKQTFKLHSLDIAIDTIDDKSIDYKYKESFEVDLMPYSKEGVIKPPNGATTLYINNIDHQSINKIAYYDKYLKQTKHHKQGGLNKNLKHWKRLEVTISSDKRIGFIDYIESMRFYDDIYLIDDIATKAGITHYEDDYLIYQLNSFIDNRVLNNRESRKQFNSVESLERFKQSDFRRYLLVI